MIKAHVKSLTFLKSFKSRCSLLNIRRQSSNLLLQNDLLVVSDEIKYSNKPVVALESTIITHGLPYPQNLETALQVEEIIRAEGALPATIGIYKFSFFLSSFFNKHLLLDSFNITSH